MTTPLDALINALRDAASYNLESEAPPEAVVWCDVNNEFATLMPALRERMPELLTYGDYDPATRSGPAVWPHAALDLAVPTGTLADGRAPIIYIPDVRGELSTWESKVKALPTLIDDALAAAAALLEPKSRTVTLPAAMLTSEAELDEWLTKVRATMVEALSAGPVIPKV